MKLTVLASAQRHIDEAIDYYAEQAGNAVAARFVEEFDDATRRLLQFPTIGTKVSARLRACALGRCVATRTRSSTVLHPAN